MFTTTIRPRFSDTDALGHINNTVIPVWFLEARGPVLTLFAPEGDWRRTGLVVVRTETDFLAETRFGQDVTVKTWVQRIGNSSFTLYQEIWQGETRTARGLTTLVNFDTGTRRSRPVPANIREELERHRRSGEEPPAGPITGSTP